MREIIHNLLQNSWYIIIGIANCLTGYDLLSNEHFFFWPPQFQNVMNDDRVDWIMLITGLSLLIYSILNRHSNWIITLLLSVSAAFYTLLGVLMWEHVQFAGTKQMTISASLCFIFVLVIFNVARIRKRDHR